MFDRAKYKDIKPDEVQVGDSHIGMYKYDGANFFLPIEHDGSLRFFSRRESVKGGFPERTESLPHLTDKKVPDMAGSVFNVELIHTGRDPAGAESHRQVSGILNSLPAKAIASQSVLGPIRAVLHNVINPDLKTYRQKLEYMKEFEKAYGRPDLLFVSDHAIGDEGIRKLIRKTKENSREGVVITHLDRDESSNVRWKVKHKIHHNVRITRLIREISIKDVPKDSIGAVEVSDATGRVVGRVGTGFSRAMRQDMFKNPEKYLGKIIQVESMGFAVNALRMPSYNGDADGEIDVVN